MKSIPKIKNIIQSVQHSAYLNTCFSFMQGSVYMKTENGIRSLEVTNHESVVAAHNSFLISINLNLQHPLPF